MKTKLELLGFLVLSAALAASAQAPEAGYLIDVSGSWTSDKGVPLKMGSAVLPAQLLDGKGTGSPRITIAYLDGSFETHQCQPNTKCVYTVKTIVPKPASWPEQILRSIKSLGTHRDTMPVNAISRDIEVLNPAVLPLRGNQLDLKDAVIQLDQGAYDIVLKPLSKRPNGARVSGSVMWDAPQSTSASLPGLVPGVYELTLLSPDGGRIGSETVLLATPEDYDKKLAAYRQARQFLDSQPAGATPAAIHNLLTALLFDLEDRP